MTKVITEDPFDSYKRINTNISVLLTQHENSGDVLDTSSSSHKDSDLDTSASLSVMLITKNTAQIGDNQEVLITVAVPL